ncbi:MAG: restriction endonuclease subunit S [Ignavibacteria bacterium]|nr:restriction endonuclease subunit S [Ignavibacteria bacterium]
MTHKEAFAIGISIYIGIIKAAILGNKKYHSSLFSLNNIIAKNEKGKKIIKLKTKDYQDQGLYPIVDQGKRFICGYTNDENAIVNENLPLIIFGDHTRNFKYINFPFAIGADGTKILKPKNAINEKFFYYSLFDFLYTNKGYSRYYKQLTKHTIVCPYHEDQNKSIEFQKRIVNFLDDLEVQKIKGVYFDERLETIIKDLQEYIILNNDLDVEINFQVDLVRQLRQAFLSEAMQGKLVPQDPNDEPATELLKKIKREKEKLIKSKKLKAGKSTGKSVSLIKHNSIPSTWIWCKTDEMFFITKLAGFEYTEHIKLQLIGEIPVIRAQNVRPLKIEKTNLLYIDKETSLLLNRCSLTKKCLLVTFIGAGIGDVAIFDEKQRWHLAPNVAKMEPFDGCEELINVRFINYFLMSGVGQREIFKHIKATAQPSLSMGTIRDIDIPIPPIQEQHRIVDKIDQLMQYCDELEHSIKQSKEQTEQLLQVALKEALTV